MTVALGLPTRPAIAIRPPSILAWSMCNSHGNSFLPARKRRAAKTTNKNTGSQTLKSIVPAVRLISLPRQKSSAQDSDKTKRRCVPKCRLFKPHKKNNKNNKKIGEPNRVRYWPANLIDVFPVAPKRVEYFAERWMPRSKGKEPRPKSHDVPDNVKSKYRRQRKKPGDFMAR